MMCPLVPVSCIPRAVLLYFSFSSARTLADLKEKKKQVLNRSRVKHITEGKVK